MQCSFTCHNVIMISFLSTVPQCQMPEFRKSSCYSSARTALSLLLCQLLHHKQQLLLHAVNECLVYKHLFSYPGLWVKAAEVLRRVPLVEAFCSLFLHDCNGVQEKCWHRHLYHFCKDCASGGAAQVNNLPRLWDLLDAAEQILSQTKKSPSTQLNLRYISGCVIWPLLRKKWDCPLTI